MYDVHIQKSPSINDMFMYKYKIYRFVYLTLREWNHFNL